MSVEKFKKGSSIMDGGSSEWDESKHPRDKGGKFTSGGGDFEKPKSITDASNSEGESLTKSPKSVRLEIDSPSTREIYERISRGELLSFEELANNSALAAMDEIADRYYAQYGNTSEINTPEREQLREDILQEFMSSGSYSGRDANGNSLFKGKIQKGHKAIIAIGLPASGKSTRIAEPMSRELGAFVFVNDEIKKKLPEYKASKGGAANAVHKESGLIQERAFQQFLSGARQGENLVIPTIGSNLGKLQRDWIARLEDAGYDVEVQFADTDPVKSANYGVKRAIETGRIIPTGVRLSYKDKPREVFEALKTLKGKGGKPYVR
jgi:hypothetical protein